MSRKSLIDDDQIVSSIVLLTRAGLYAQVAAEYSGIDRTTFYRWMRRGEREKKGKYHDFCNTIKKARSEAIYRNVEKIRNAKEWQSKSWLLERMHPELFALRKPNTVSVTEVHDFADSLVLGISKIVKDADIMQKIIAMVQRRFKKLKKAK